MISGVSLEVAPGEITTLVGPNGAGKTSLLEAISGVVTSVGGQIRMDDHDLQKLSRRKRAKLGVSHVEQGRMIFPSLTVHENLKITARNKADVDEALSLFPELEKRIGSQTMLLSGGEQQMVVLARAFASKPRYLLIDEMSLGLAPVVFLRLIPTIKQIADTGVGVLLVEQFAHLALSMANHAVVVTGGRVSFQGAPAELLSDGDLLREAYLG
ncbi:ABC transporter ATP-binding protein [Microbacterium pygmaeum]|uniref:ABC transporter ATP-binding protein n=1 Tax=Microbacterium pygmaeum TaxID=370764 RepID=UPI001E571E1E|nr:ABC transporter ATP-binding protein [Microbacterium pygmaeum]